MQPTRACMHTMRSVTEGGATPTIPVRSCGSAVGCRPPVPSNAPLMLPTRRHAPPRLLIITRRFRFNLSAPHKRIAKCRGAVVNAVRGAACAPLAACEADPAHAASLEGRHQHRTHAVPVPLPLPVPAHSVPRWPAHSLPDRPSNHPFDRRLCCCSCAPRWRSSASASQRSGCTALWQGRTAAWHRWHRRRRSTLSEWRARQIGYGQ